MKNIHILPTDKPSSIWINYVVKRLIYGQFTSNDTKINCQNQNIYITSDEEIKEGDWSFDIRGFIEKVDETYDLEVINALGKKIILTTDQDLIKDGVQAIDDEFLEWFVKNPSCEKVEAYHSKIDEARPYMYYLTIPKEEPKTDEWLSPMQKFSIRKEEPKQGSMSEAVKQAITDIMKSDEELGLYEPELDDLNPYIGPFLLRNGFSKRQSSNNIYYNLECIVTILEDCYEINFNDPQCGEVTMYTDSWSIMHLVGLLTWYDLIEKNYKK